jgi:uncharacterized protein (DUF58 family)
MRQWQRMRARLPNLRSVFLGRIEYKVTRGGLLFITGILLVGSAALVSANNLLFLILAMMLATLLVSGFISRLCLAGLELDFQVPDHISARRVFPARIYVRNLKLWMPSFSIHVVGTNVRISPVYFPAVAGGATVEESLEVYFDRRGAHRQSSFSFSTRFPFSFIEKSSLVRLAKEIVVYPSLEPKPGFDELIDAIAGEIESHEQGLGRDFYRIRPYQHFESARHVDWRATAHTGDLQVREFAREQERSVEICFDCEIPPGSEESFEQAVDCCAFLVWRLSQQGMAIRFRSQAFETRVPEEGDIYIILKYLALAGAQNGKTPPPPIDDSSYQVVLSLLPGKFQDLEWVPDRILGPDRFAAAAHGAAIRAPEYGD